MPFIITDGTTDAKADPTFDALRMSPRHAETDSKCILTMQSGALTGVAASNSTGTVFSLRQIDTSVLLLRKIQLGWITTTGYTAAQIQDFGVAVVRSFSASDSGGTAFNPASNNTELKTTFTGLTSIDMRIAGAAALTAGTRTVDTNLIGAVGCYNVAATAGAYIPMFPLFDQPPGDHPLVLSQNEGIIIYPLTAMGTGGIGTLTVQLELGQRPTY